MSTTAIVLIAAAALVVVALYFARGSGAEAAPDVAVLSQLRQAGSNLRKPHPCEFFLYLPSEAAAQRVGSKLASHGFAVEVRAAASGKPEWLALATRTMVPEVAELVRLRALFSELAAAEQGSYDGWGTPVVR